jgi:uroporphyrinogen-III synthase
MYTTKPMCLSEKQKDNLLRGTYSSIAFKSPSGISGLLQQFARIELAKIKSLKAVCIGSTTAGTARKAGFRNVTVSSL